MKKIIFVTSVGGDVACSALRCLMELKEEFRIIGCDINEYVQGKMYIDDFVISPRYDNVEIYKNFIQEMCINYGVSYFLPIGEQEIVIASSMRDFFCEHNINLVINNDNLINIAINKYKTFQFCKEIGIAVPETIRVSDYKKESREKSLWEGSFPMILKKESGCGAKGMQHIYTKESLEKLVDEEKYQEGWILQKEIGNVDEEYTMGVFSNGEKTEYIAFRRKLGFGSMSIKVETIIDEKLQHIAERISNKLSLYGSINVQLRKENGTYYVFEINPRLSSTCAFRHLNGFKDTVWWIKLMDHKLENIDFKPIQGKIGIKVLDEILF